MVRVLVLSKVDKVIDLTSVDKTAPRDIQAVIADGALSTFQAIADRAGDNALLNFDELTFNIPISAPGKILCLGLNYMDHVNEGIFEKQLFPTIFMRTASSMVAHKAPVIRPVKSETLDFEAELALIIGKKARHLTAEHALEYVAGYSCANDASVREYQRTSNGRWANFDQTGPLGPVFMARTRCRMGQRGWISVAA